MNFYIKKGSTLPKLKMLLIRDGRSDFHSIIQDLSSSQVFFSMYDVEKKLPKIVNSPCQIFEIVNSKGETELYIEYSFKKKDTTKSGKFRAEFTIKNNEGVFILPIQEGFNIFILDSNVTSENCCPNPSTILFNLSVSINSGSVVLDYTLFSSFSFDHDVTIFFKHTIGKKLDSPIILNLDLKLLKGDKSSTKKIMLTNENFENLDGSSLISDVIFSPLLNPSGYNLISYSSFNDITPTPTPSSTPIHTPSPTVTETGGITPTPTPTFDYQNIYDAIIVGSNQYLKVGDGLYLKFE